MNTQNEVQQSRSAVLEDDPVGEVLRALGLSTAGHPQCPSARVLRKGHGSAPIAAILEQGETFREDKRTILALKTADRDLPIIFIASTNQARREMAIRRLCIHYFLAHPVDCEELRLVLDVLVRTTAPTPSCERFFTR